MPQGIALGNQCLFYGGTQVDNPANVVQKTSNPPTGKTSYKLGTIWINKTSGSSYILVKKTTSTSTWSENFTASGTTAAMTAGTITVNTAAVTATSKIFLTANTPGGTAGILSAPTASITAGTSFVINSSSGTDTSTVNWLIVN